jgi:hypothetical protein
MPHSLAGAVLPLEGEMDLHVQRLESTFSQAGPQRILEWERSLDETDAVLSVGGVAEFARIRG